MKFKETEKVADSLENIFMRKMPVMYIQWVLILREGEAGNKHLTALKYKFKLQNSLSDSCMSQKLKIKG